MIITNLQIHPVSSPPIPCGYIRMEAGKIVRVGPMPAPAPHPEETVEDFMGAVAVPGFVDAHSHLGMFGDSLGFEAEDGNEMTDPLTPQLRALDAINPLDKGFSEALAAGVTTVLTGPGSANPVSGQSVVMKTHGCCVDEMILLSPASMKLALGENPKGVYSPRNQAPGTRMGISALIREELTRAMRYRADVEKAQQDEELELPEYDAKCEAMLPVLTGELPVHIHAHRADDIFTALRICREFALKGVLVHATEGHFIAPALQRAGVPVICGPILASRCKPELAGASRTTPGILAAAGVKTAICTDHPELPQDSLALCAAIAYAEGMDQQQALAAITLTAAEICGVAKRVGSLEVGKDGDVVVFPRHPLEGIVKPIAVFIDGFRVI